MGHPRGGLARRLWMRVGPLSSRGSRLADCGSTLVIRVTGKDDKK